MSPATEDILSAGDVIPDLSAGDKQGVLEELCGRAAARLGLDGAELTAEILGREALGSTGLGKGIAIPHARLAQLKRPFAMLARLRRSVEFDAIDARPVDIVVLLLMPAGDSAGQIGLLAGIARRLRDEAVLSQMREARGATDLRAAFLGTGQAIGTDRGP
ncbi:MAG: PTS sugar transporter subunit IIA [Devosia sp.]|nr:PTS sugar transporter subunit IIA [Devosia sp.]